MSSSDASSKIDFLDDPSVIKKKIKDAYAVPGEVEGNGLLAFVKAVILPIAALKPTSPFALDGCPTGTIFSINRPDKHGGPLHYTDYADIEKNYADQTLHPADLKLGVQEAINQLLKPIQDEYNSDPSFRETERLAYPPPEEPAKKVKQKKQNPRFAKPEGESVGANGQVPAPPTEGLANVSLEQASEQLSGAASKGTKESDESILKDAAQSDDR